MVVIPYIEWSLVLKELPPMILAWLLCIVSALCLLWDAYDLIFMDGDNTVSSYIRSTWLKWPVAIAIGIMVAEHFARWRPH